MVIKLAIRPESNPIQNWRERRVLPLSYFHAIHSDLSDLRLPTVGNTMTARGEIILWPRFVSSDNRKIWSECKELAIDTKFIRKTVHQNRPYFSACSKEIQT